jgi:hypothetical protein
LLLWIAAADIGMHAGKPDLQCVLRLRVGLVEAVVREGLRLDPVRLQSKIEDPAVAGGV